ncbi:hypothetical protein OTB20_26815 [Streptomyces sp. H27-H1]|nr:hypothetical protein [Streptomyces sp. H27-H1]
MMLRRLRDCSARTQAEIASAGFLVATSLSNHLNGARIPAEPQVRSFFKAIQDEVSAPGAEDDTPWPCTLEELLELRLLARAQHCDCMPHSENDTKAPQEEADSRADDGAPAPRRPERGPVRRADRRLGIQRRPNPSLRSRSRALSRAAIDTAVARSRMPVPPEEGDRLPAGSLAAGWTELETLAGFMAAGRNRDAGLLLWRAGTTLSATEVLEVVHSCRTAGFHEAAESVLTSVGERADKQAVLNIAAAFQQAGQSGEVGLLLSAATP